MNVTFSQMFWVRSIAYVRAKDNMFACVGGVPRAHMAGGEAMHQDMIAPCYVPRSLSECMHLWNGGKARSQ